MLMNFFLTTAVNSSSLNVCECCAGICDMIIDSSDRRLIQATVNVNVG